MDIKYSISPTELKTMSSAQIREHLLVPKLFEAGKVHQTYSFDDRFILGGFCPLDKPLTLDPADEIRQDYFLQTREMGVINIGGPGTITADGETFHLDYEDGAYLGCETREVSFASDDPQKPAKFYTVSMMAFKKYPNSLVTKDMTQVNTFGSQEESSLRIVKKYIYKGGPVRSNQLVMGVNSLQPGNVWNTVPTHTHRRRVECFMYYNLPANAFYVSFCGDPKESRHVVVRNEQAVISAAWQMHFGAGTTNYDFIFTMGGENQDFPDMDVIPMTEIE